MAVTIYKGLEEMLAAARNAAGRLAHLHITADGWTARFTGLSYAGVTAHFVTEDFNRESRIPVSWQKALASNCWIAYEVIF